jgi:preprotein translocase subunit SecG
MLTAFIITVHLTVAFALIVIVLLQQGKGASMGAGFGGSSQTIFGSRGPATALAKITTGAAIIFMLTSITLSALSNSSKDSTIMPVSGEPAKLPTTLPPISPTKEGTAETSKNVNKVPVGTSHESGGPLEKSGGSKPEAAGPVDTAKPLKQTGG